MTDFEKIKALNKNLRETINEFIEKNGLSCDKCSNMVNGKCKSKLYCIVGEKIGLYVNFNEKE